MILHNLMRRSIQTVQENVVLSVINTISKSDKSRKSLSIENNDKRHPEKFWEVVKKVHEEVELNF